MIDTVLGNIRHKERATRYASYTILKILKGG